MEARIGFAGGSRGGGIGRSVSTGYNEESACTGGASSLESASEEDEPTAVESPESCVVVGDSADMGGADWDVGDVEWDSRQNERRRDEGVVGEAGCCDLGFGLGFTRAVLAHVHASRRALKQASPGFHDASSRMSLRLLVRLASAEA